MAPIFGPPCIVLPLYTNGLQVSVFDWPWRRYIAAGESILTVSGCRQSSITRPSCNNYYYYYYYYYCCCCCCCCYYYYFFALGSIRPEGQKQEAKNKISTVARGPDLRQDKMTPEWAPSCSAVSRLTAAGTGKRSHVDLGMKHSSDDRPRSGSQDPTHSVGRDSRRR